MDAQQLIQTVSRSALSQVLNPMENLWSILVRRYCEGNKVYPSKDTLLDAALEHTERADLVWNL